MATIHKEFTVRAPVAHVWAAFRDIGAIHSRLAQQFVTDTRVEGESRLVTFANGVVVREQIVSIDDDRRRLAYAVVEWQATHYNASFQLFAEGEARTRIVWIADLLPNDLATLVEGLMAQGVTAMTHSLESTAVSTAHGKETIRPGE
jgi:Polyketide cyclase / dehydrase and lipid transport